MRQGKCIKLLVVLMIMSILGGCTIIQILTRDTSIKMIPITQEGIKTKKEEVVTLKWYMSVDSVEPDTEKVIEALNVYTRDKIGVEIDYIDIIDAEYKQKMPMYINAGEYFDICFTANWTNNYLQSVGRDAFMDITEILPEYAKETYEFIPDMIWDAISVEGRIYGIPSYKELGRQCGFFVNADMAKAYGIDLTTVKTLEDYSQVLKIVKEKSIAEGKEVIGISGLRYSLLEPYESLTGIPTLPGASPVKEYCNFTAEEEVFNQYASETYMDYCQLAYDWNQAGYTPADPINYDGDIANRDNDFKNGKLFSYLISYAPGTAEAATASMGHGVTFIPLMDPLFETRNAMAGVLAISSQSKHPDKALEFLNLLNTDKYVGTLIRHGIEGQHHSLVGDNRVDKTMGGTLPGDINGYSYTPGWRFGTPFNQKWDISYPENIEELFESYNASAIVAPHNGFSFNTLPVATVITALTNVIDEYGPALETGCVDPKENIPKFLKALEDNGVNTLLKEIETQIHIWQKRK
nr:ABC transporter substrate-binding protein [uncultured Niameybacter sp.]